MPTVNKYYYVYPEPRQDGNFVNALGTRYAINFIETDDSGTYLPPYSGSVPSDAYFTTSVDDISDLLKQYDLQPYPRLNQTLKLWFNNSFLPPY